ncbi:hypothetical protein [Mesorhizobium sp. B2-3-5]|uniref:hypothetical protein n=1 Tax=Mesorhizobium sp. B2-3-5 TaxID=2589958 RepID=UPI00112A506F|nr:hypothetical protein [Mesorhizobium sp. B2-3-5]TPM27053.1 hypothetical protein FJ958_17945 [Mesorhizobium sp. B2-3-5]
MPNGIIHQSGKVTIPTILTRKPLFCTPPIPARFRSICSPGYVNIFKFGLGNKNLWGTETMFGDWNGEYLLVAKDFYPASYIRLLQAAGEKYPYRHHPGIHSNTKLMNILHRDFKILRIDALGSDGNCSCNFLYISACFLLRDDGVISGALPEGGDAAMEASEPVVLWTMGKENMPNLKNIVAMGDDAKRALERGPIAEMIRRRKLRHFTVPHPSRGSLAKRTERWAPVFDAD